MRAHVLVSAHRCGGVGHPTRDNTPEGVRWTASIGADYVEFDVRRAADGRLVCRHDPVGADEPAPALDELLAAVAAAGLGAHVDLKGTDVAAWCRDAAERCAEALDLSRVVFTTGSARAAALLTRWAEERPDGAPYVGLTVGGSTRHLRLPAAVRARVRELYPGRRWRESEATVLAAHHVLARVRLLRWARRRDVRVLVWTADSPRVLAAAMRDPRVWMVTTNRPEAALALRATLSS